MEFGIQFFPDVGPGEKSAAQYCLCSSLALLLCLILLAP